MIVLNFSHPLTPDHIAQLHALTGQSVERVVEIPTHLDTGKPFGPQVVELADRAGLSPAEWQTLPLAGRAAVAQFCRCPSNSRTAWTHGLTSPHVSVFGLWRALPPRYEIASK